MLTITRRSLSVIPSEGVVKGISEDGGLFIFENADEFVFGKELLSLNYQELSEVVLDFVFDDFKTEDLKEIISCAYSEKNFDKPVDMKVFGRTAFLELWHGPTHAFKDMALTVLGRLMVKAKQNIGETDDTVIITATSGDTGSATLSGFSGTGINAIVIYPDSGVSAIQEEQMHYFAKDGSRAIAVEGNFDFCQTLVKKIFTDKTIELNRTKLSSANSINIGRLVPQIIYYMHAYCELVRREKITFGEKINFTVPTGNFGNILAGYIAKKMGTPINKFICASNKNDVLTEFFKTGVYSCQREFYKTISPSMDILISSNLERLLYLASDCNYQLIESLMMQLSVSGQYEIPESVKVKLDDFIAYSLNDNETESEIKAAFDNFSYLIDPHTAVALGAANRYSCENGDSQMNVVVSTANPYKFPESVCDSLNLERGKNIFDTIKIIEKHTNTVAPEGIKLLESFAFKREAWTKQDAFNRLKKLSGDKNV